MNKRLILKFIMVFFLTGCLEKNPEIQRPTLNAKIDHQTTDVEDIDIKNIEQNNSIKVINRAFLEDKFRPLKKYLGKKSGVDCSGFVFLVNRDYENLFFTAKEVSNSYDKSGRRSKAIYNLYKKKQRIVSDGAEAGDLIFFSNTTGYDLKKNKDKENITHLGVVTKVFDDGRIEFIHNLRGIVKIGYMDLNNKNRHKISNIVHNSYIIKCKKGLSGCLTSHRFSGFAKVDNGVF